MSNKVNKNAEWETRGKTITQLIKKLKTFDNQDMEVKISIDDGESYKCISLVGKENDNGVFFCGLRNCE